MIQHIVQFNLSGRQVKEICERGSDEDSDISTDTTSPHVRRFVKSMKQITEQDTSEFVENLLSQEQSPTLARARLDEMITFLTRAKHSLEDKR